MTIIRAYSVLESKQFNDQQRTIHGIATSPALDRVGDSVDQYGVTAAASIPLFMYHDSRKTVGRAMLGKATAKGIPFEATFPNVAESGALKDRVDEAVAMVKYGLITAVSIGFRVLDGAYEVMKNGGIKYLKTEVMELSLVPVPAQPEAVIAGYKSMDEAGQRAALLKHIKSADEAIRRTAFGAGRVVRLDTVPAASGTSLPGDSGTSNRRKGVIYLD